MFKKLPSFFLFIDVCNNRQKKLIAAATGNRTRAARVAGEHSTTRLRRPGPGDKPGTFSDLQFNAVPPKVFTKPGSFFLIFSLYAKNKV